FTVGQRITSRKLACRAEASAKPTICPPTQLVLRRGTPRPHRGTQAKAGSGSGSHTHLKKFMRLLSVHWSSFPQLKLVESVVTLPSRIRGTCRASVPRLRDLPRPQIKMAGCLRAARSELGFGDSTAC